MTGATDPPDPASWTPEQVRDSLAETAAAAEHLAEAAAPEQLTALAHTAAAAERMLNIAEQWVWPDGDDGAEPLGGR
jgi:hypothetical protein